MENNKLPVVTSDLELLKERLDSLKLPVAITSLLLFSIFCCCGSCNACLSSSDDVKEVKKEGNDIADSEDLGSKLKIKGFSDESKQKSLDLLKDDKSRAGELVNSILDLWSVEVEEGEMYFMYLDLFNDFNNCGEIAIQDWYNYKDKNGGAGKVHDENRKELGQEFGCSTEIIMNDTNNAKVLNNLYWYRAKDGKIVESKSVDDIRDVYHDNFKDSLEKNFEDLLEKQNSIFSKKLVENDLVASFKRIVVGQGAAESNYDMSAVSVAGAKGVFQIMPDDREALIKKYQFEGFKDLDVFSQDLFLLMGHYSDQYDYVYNSLSEEEKVKFNAIVEKKELFEKVLLPLFVTGYNQGKGRATRLFKLLVEVHESGDLPDYAYVEDSDKEWKDINGDVIVYLMPKALKIVRSKKYEIKKGYEEEFKENNGGYGLDGVIYYFKCLASGYAVMEPNIESEYSLLDETFSDDPLPTYREAQRIHDLSQQRYIEALIPHIGNVEHGISWYEVEDENVTFAKNRNGKYIIGDDHRRKLPSYEDFEDIYGDIAADIYDETGKKPEVTSTFRDGITQKAVNSFTSYSYHLDGQAVDLRSVSFDSDEQKVVASVLAKYALEGKIAYRIEQNPPHWHVVLVPEENRFTVSRYFEGKSDSKARPKKKTVGKFSNMKLIDSYRNFKLGEVITSYEKGLALRDQETGALIRYIPRGHVVDVTGVVENIHMKRYNVRYEGVEGTVIYSSKDIKVSR